MNPGGSQTVGAMTTVSLRRSIGDLTFDPVLITPDGLSDGTVSAPTILVFHGMQSRSDAQIAIAVHHGWDDRPAPPEDVVALGRDPTSRGADWQLHAYGDAMHAFMAPFADQPERGIQYHPVVAERVWRALGVLLSETFTD